MHKETTKTSPLSKVTVNTQAATRLEYVKTVQSGTHHLTTSTIGTK